MQIFDGELPSRTSTLVAAAEAMNPDPMPIEQIEQAATYDVRL